VEKIEALPQHASTELFSETEHVVLEYADAMTHTPVEVSDAMFARMCGKFTEA
jgi:hypothetical protein